MLDTASEAAYDAVFAADMVYGRECWKRCGDGHCCHFSRYRPPGQPVVQEFPLFDGELEYMDARGLLAQYARYETTLWELDLSVGTYRFQTLQVPSGGACPCDHHRRPTVCRLYPLLPMFELGRGVVAFDTRFTLYEEAEALAGLPRACRVEALAFEELNKLLGIARAIYSAPRYLFSVMAYALHKQHVLSRVASHMAFSGHGVHRSLFELQARDGLVDLATLGEDLETLAGNFREHYDAGFRLS